MPKIAKRNALNHHLLTVRAHSRKPPPLHACLLVLKQARAIDYSGTTCAYDTLTEEMRREKMTDCLELEDIASTRTDMWAPGARITSVPSIRFKSFGTVLDMGLRYLDFHRENFFFPTSANLAKTSWGHINSFIRILFIGSFWSHSSSPGLCVRYCCMSRSVFFNFGMGIGWMIHRYIYIRVFWGPFFLL